MTVAVGTPGVVAHVARYSYPNTLSSVIRRTLAISGVVPYLMSNYRLHSYSFFKMHVSYGPVNDYSIIAAYGGLR